MFEIFKEKMGSCMYLMRVKVYSVAYLHIIVNETIVTQAHIFTQKQLNLGSAIHFN